MASTRSTVRSPVLLATVLAALGCGEPGAAPVTVVDATARVSEPTAAAPDPPVLVHEPEPHEIVDSMPFDPPGGVQGGIVGTPPPPSSPPPPPPPGSRRAPATMLGHVSACPFPPEADAEGIDSATVHAVVRVDAAGKPKQVTITKDPGAGFGRAARKCLLAQTYTPGLDDAGIAVESTTSTVVVRFSR